MPAKSREKRAEWLKAWLRQEGKHTIDHLGRKGQSNHGSRTSEVDEDI